MSCENEYLRSGILDVTILPTLQPRVVENGRASFWHSPVSSFGGTLLSHNAEFASRTPGSKTSSNTLPGPETNIKKIVHIVEGNLEPARSIDNRKRYA